MAIGANNLLMLALSNYRRKLFDLQTFQNQAHIISVTGIIIYFLGTYYLYTVDKGVKSQAKSQIRPNIKESPPSFPPMTMVPTTAMLLTKLLTL